MQSKPKFSNVDEYISSFPPETRERLEVLRKIVRELAPDALEIISYGIPAYKFSHTKGYPPIYFSGNEKHLAIYPIPGNMPEALAKDVEPHVAGKGTLRFYLKDPLPIELITRIFTHMVKQAKK